MAIVNEPLGGGIYVPTMPACRFTQDAVHLARFAAPKPTDTVCDLGSGCGILPFLWCRRDPPTHITAVEREPAFTAAMRDAVTAQHLNTRITVCETDWANDDTMPAAHTMTLVTCNPPYFPFGASRPSADPLAAAARHEDRPDLLAVVCRAAARLLTEHGRFCLCHRPERLADVFAALAAEGLRPRRLQFVQANEKATPSLVLIEAAAHGALHVLPTMIAHSIGDHTDAYKRLYR